MEVRPKYKGGVLVKKIPRALMVCLLLICSLTGCRSAPLSEMTIVPYGEITEETVYEFHDLMGCNGYIFEVPLPGGQILRYYYAKTKTGESFIAHTFGFPGISTDYLLDIDNDGMREIVANVCYGDGAQRVEVWRMRDGSVEVGRVDQSLYDEFYAVFRSISEYYDPTRHRIHISFRRTDDMTVTWEWDDFSHFSFNRNP